MSFEYIIEECGRVKMAGGSFSTYYDLAGSLIHNNQPTAEQIISTNNNFKNIRKQPSFDLLLAFFPDDYENIQHRLRGAGAYRHLRMDQGPGGVFTRFDMGANESLHFNLKGDKGFALPEALINEQISDEKYANLLLLAEEIQKSFQKNDYKKTALLVNKFKYLANESGLRMHSGEHVGSKSGFFFIRPAVAEENVEFPISKIPQLKEKIDEALNKSLSLAEYTKQFLREKHSFEQAVMLAEAKYLQNGNIDYQGDGLLYFQPDCFVDKNGRIEVEKINMPDVGMFMTLLTQTKNPYLQRVVDANLILKDKLKQAAQKFFDKDHIVLITRPEVVEFSSDTLEIMEIKALRSMLESIGKKVEVKSLEEYETIDKNSEVLLLNVDAKDKNYGKFASHIIHNDIHCFSDPLVYYFKDKATTLQTMQIPAKHMEHFLQLIKPKDITAKNAENIYERLQYIMKRFDMKDDIIYASISGYKMPIPVFKYSLHSFGQIYKAYDKVKAQNPVIQLSGVPVNEENAVFEKNGAPILSAFRFMCTKER